MQIAPRTRILDSNGRITRGGGRVVCLTGGFVRNRTNPAGGHADCQLGTKARIVTAGLENVAVVIEDSEQTFAADADVQKR